MFPSVPPSNLSLPAAEQATLRFWNDPAVFPEGAFRESLKRNADKPVYQFYDGPPFATGLPHHGHVLAGTIKDVVTRYAHQTGHSVERRFGLFLIPPFCILRSSIFNPSFYCLRLT